MSVRIIVPHRGLAVAKTRLASVLADADREALALRLLERVLGVLRAAWPDVVVITPSSALSEVVARAGGTLVVQKGLGLNEGLEQARGEARDDGIDVLGILHGDLPNLTEADVDALIGPVASTPGVAIAPDRAQMGTNGLALNPVGAIGFRFGPGSLAAHRREADQSGLSVSIVERPGLAFDLDTPADLARWLELGDAA